MAQLPVTGAAAGLQLGEESSCSRTSDRSSSASSSDMSEVKLAALLDFRVKQSFHKKIKNNLPTTKNVVQFSRIPIFFCRLSAEFCKSLTFLKNHFIKNKSNFAE
jgi:hypothetical protein